MITRCIITASEYAWETDRGQSFQREVCPPSRFVCEEDYILVHRVESHWDVVTVFSEDGAERARLSVPRCIGGELLVMYVCYLSEYELCIRVTLSTGVEWIDGLYCLKPDGKWIFLRMTTDLIMRLMYGDD